MKKKCLLPTCNRKPRMRGLCQICHANYRASIKANLITEEQAVARGMVAPKIYPFASGRFKKPRKEPWIEMLNAQT